MRANVQVNKIISYFHIQKAEKVHQWKNVEVNQELFFNKQFGLVSFHAQAFPYQQGLTPPSPQAAGSRDMGCTSHWVQCQPPLAERVFEG